MPTSTLLQLVARGRQDVYLTGEPQFTFFKHVYRRHTPFAIESIPIEFDGNADFGQRISCLIPRKADLLGPLFLEIDLPPLPQPLPQPSPNDGPTNFWVNDIGHAIIKDVSIEIGDKEIDKHTGEWLNIWGELTTPVGKRDGYYNMVGHWPDYPPISSVAAQPLHLSIPLRFWFCNTIGAALPLIALQAHPVRLIIHLRPFRELWWSSAMENNCGACIPWSYSPVSPSRIQLFGDYYFLEKEERQRFASAEHEYLIDQLQISPPQSVSAGTTHTNCSLMFNHCCKEFIWVVQRDAMQCANEWFNYSSDYFGSVTGDDLLTSAMLRLDGYDRFYQRNAVYFRRTQPYQYHTNVPDNFIYLYSFALRPEEHQPSGTMNASKIDDIILSLRFPAALSTDQRTVSVFAVNYNILRIIGGLGGLAFIA
jgi:hypothetical protein